MIYKYLNFILTYIRVIILGLICMQSIVCFASYRIKVHVIDSISEQPIPFSAIFIKGTGTGTLSDNHGRAELNTNTLPCYLEITMMGYESKGVEIDSTTSTTIISLIPSGVELEEVIVKKQKEHYSKRNNRPLN